MIDHELHGFGLTDGRERTGAAREHVRQARGTNVFGCDELALRDGDGSFGNRDHVAGTRDAVDRGGNERSEIVAFAHDARAHGDRN